MTLFRLFNRDDVLYVRTNHNAPHYKIAQFDVTAPNFVPTDVVCEDPRGMMTKVVPVGTNLMALLYNVEVGLASNEDSLLKTRFFWFVVTGSDQDLRYTRGSRSRDRSTGRRKCA